MYGKDGDALGILQNEGELLYGFVRGIKPEIIVEFGTGHGTATSFLAQGCRDNGFGKVITFDIHERQNQAEARIKGAGLQEFVEFYRERIKPEGLVDMAFLDAEHTTEAVADYLNWLHGISRNEAVVIIHDALEKDHVKKVSGTWSLIMLPQTGMTGMAILQKGEI